MNAIMQDTQTVRPHRVDLDILKAISIIAVVFYHIGWLDTGYLGVDVFFAINGFLIVPSLVKQIASGTFNYPTFLLKRIMRLWPLVLLVSTLSMVVGYVIGMLPDDYENLSQSVIASDVMSQNILSAITTRDYWAAANEYKPLMHFWYLGILVEFYVLIPLVLILTKYIANRLKLNVANAILAVLLTLSIVSFVLYLSPNITDSDKFYYIHCRCWELLIGGIIGIAVNKKHSDKNSNWSYVILLGIILILCSSQYLPHAEGMINSVSGQIPIKMFIPQNILLVLSVILTCIILNTPPHCVPHSKLIDIVALIGKMSFSIYVWHQVLLGFYRYFCSNDMSVGFVAGLWVLTIVLSIITYYTIEQKLKPSWCNFAVCCVVFLLNCTVAGVVYVKAGTVRDVPELGVYEGETRRGQFAEYCDRVYAYNVDFPDNEKINVLVEGVSFGRDFANILLESEVIHNINLSYVYQHDEKYFSRYRNCDYLFTFRSKSQLPNYVTENINCNAKVYGLGTKNYGECNGVVYRHRNSTDYFEQTTRINPNFYTINNQWRQEWGSDNYIDFLELSTMPNGEIRIFTDTNRFISQDCQHLTQDGAKWYAKIIDWTKIFNK